MLDEAAITDTPQPPPAEPPRDGNGPPAPTLEQRVRHLEEAVATLQDTGPLEERIVQRVTARVVPPPSHGVRESAGLFLEAGRQLLPAAVAALGATASAAQPSPPAQAVPLSPAPPPAAPARPPWLPYDIYAEFRALVRMYLDPRFRVTWAARLLPLVLIPAIATSWIWLPGTAVLNKISFDIVGTLYDKAVDLVLAFVLFKGLHRDVTRYRSTSTDLPPTMRL